MPYSARIEQLISQALADHDLTNEERLAIIRAAMDEHLDLNLLKRYLDQRQADARRHHRQSVRSRQRRAAGRAALRMAAWGARLWQQAVRLWRSWCRWARRQLHSPAWWVLLACLLFFPVPTVLWLLWRWWQRR